MNQIETFLADQKQRDRLALENHEREILSIEVVPSAPLYEIASFTVNWSEKKLV